MNKLALMLLIIPALIFTLFLIRLTSQKEIDDVSPEIPCKQEYLKKADILWVIPKFNNKPISENQKWCQKILNLNKTIGLHGLTHKFEEFGKTQNQGYLQEAIDIFEKCFKIKPKMFKPPQLKINKENKRLIKKNNLKLKLDFNQLIHKVYHCSDTGRFSNKFIDLF